MSITTEADTAADDLIAQGQSVYNERLKAQLEPEHIGRFVAIEPSTGRYFLGDTGTTALVAAQAAMPGSLFYLTRVGRESAHTVGGHASRIR